MTRPRSPRRSAATTSTSASAFTHAADQRPRAHVVGSGPNGLAAAVRLARAGVRVTVYEQAPTPGGGCRSGAMDTGWGSSVLVDECAAFHPMLGFSPAWRDLAPAVEVAHTSAVVAHPFPGRVAAPVLRDSLADTVSGLGAAGGAWRRLFGPYVSAADEAASLALHPPLPGGLAHPLLGAGLGLPASVVAGVLPTVDAAALFGGLAAHAFAPLSQPLTSGPGLLLGALGMAGGWPVVVGGSGQLVQALVDELRSLGGEVLTHHPVRTVGDVVDYRPGDGVISTSVPLAAAAVASSVAESLPAGRGGGTLRGRVRAAWGRGAVRAWRRFRFGPGAYKVDLVLRGTVPWTAPVCEVAGTVHLGGRFSQMHAAEAACATGRFPGPDVHPFVLVGQQFLADDSRRAGEFVPLWTYAHVPQGYAGVGRTERDRARLVLDVLERYAPGVSDRVVAVRVRSAAQMSAYNPNYVGGDISAGANSVRQLLARPRLVAPSLGPGGVLLGGSSVAPGAGVHGMGGFLAAGKLLGRWGLEG